MTPQQASIEFQLLLLANGAQIRENLGEDGETSERRRHTAARSLPEPRAGGDTLPD